MPTDTTPNEPPFTPGPAHDHQLPELPTYRDWSPTGFDTSGLNSDAMGEDEKHAPDCALTVGADCFTCEGKASHFCYGCDGGNEPQPKHADYTTGAPVCGRCNGTGTERCKRCTVAPREASALVHYPLDPEPSGYAPGKVEAYDCDCSANRATWSVTPYTVNRDTIECSISRIDFDYVVARLEDIDPDGEDHESHSFGHWANGWFEIVLVRPGSTSERFARECAAVEGCLDDDAWGIAESDYIYADWSSMDLQDRIDLCKAQGLSAFAARRSSWYEAARGGSAHVAGDGSVRYYA